MDSEFERRLKAIDLEDDDSLPEESTKTKVKNAKKHIALDLEDWILHRVKA
jgi:hypothetical protein